MSTTLLVSPSSWIAVEPGTLSGQDGAHVAATCQNVLDTNGLKDVEVALMESTLFRQASWCHDETGWVWGCRSLASITTDDSRAGIECRGAG